MQESNPQNPLHNPSTVPFEPRNPSGPSNQGPQSQAPPPRKKSPLKIVGLGCGGLFLLLVLLAIIGGSGSGTSNNATSNKATQTTSSSSASSESNNLSPYFGTWTGQDGTTISIRGDGKGDFNGGNFKVQGGGGEVDNATNTLKISSFFGIGKEWKIDQAPHSSNGASEMKLNGVVYRRTSGFNPDDASSTTATSSTGSSFDEAKVPSGAEAVRLTKTTLLDFNDAVQKKNFDGFHSRISQMWQEQVSAGELTQAFQPFIKQKINIGNAVKVLSPTFKPAPSISSNGILTLEGFYPSKPSRLTFRLRFVPEDSAWKLLGIRANVVPQN